MIRPARLVGVAICAAFLLAPAQAPAAPNPADQPPFDGQPVAPLIFQSARGRIPQGFLLTRREAITIAAETTQVKSEEAKQVLNARVGTRGDDRWEVAFEDVRGAKKALVVIDDRSGEVVEAWTGHQIETKLARGYEGAIARIVSKAYIWLPLCLLFMAPFFDPKRPFRLLHLDLLVLLGFSASLFFFNKGEINTSVPLVYPVLGYLFVRMLLAGLRPSREGERSERLLPLVPWRWLVVAIVVLAVFRVGLNIADSSQVDVGYAGVLGADRIAKGEDVYSPQFNGNEDIRGDVYGPVNYLVYVPFEQVFPNPGWDHDVWAQHAAAIFFDLLTALGLLLLGFRLRPGGDRELGVTLCFAWLAYPFTLYALNANTNDALVSATLVLTLLAFNSAAGRGAWTALGGLAKYGSLALVPLFAPGDGERRWRSTLIFAGVFLAVAVVVTLPLIPDGGLRELYDRSLGYQASRGSPFSPWGLKPSLEPLQTAAKLFAVGLAAALYFVPKRRDLIQSAALAAAVLIALEVASEHWFYFYVLWFAPLVLVALFTVQRGPQPREPEAAAEV